MLVSGMGIVALWLVLLWARERRTMVALSMLGCSREVLRRMVVELLKGSLRLKGQIGHRVAFVTLKGRWAQCAVLRAVVHRGASSFHSSALAPPYHRRCPQAAEEAVRQ